jgi:hypothetical protein
VKTNTKKYYKVQDEVVSCWTNAQDLALKLLNYGQDYVSVVLWNEKENEWDLIQELNLDRGIIPKGYWSTWTLATYYTRLKNIQAN